MEFEMVKFDVEEAEIAKLKAEYMLLKIDGIKDLAGYTLVHEARMEMVRRRTSITKSGKAWRDQVNVHINNELTEEKRLLGLLKPIETHLEKEQFAIDDEKKRIKAAAEEQEKKRIQTRINRLFAFNCKFDGMDYQYQDIMIPAPAIPGMSDLEFESICTRIETAIQTEIFEQEEELRKRQEEDKRQAAERETAIEKFNKEKASQEAERKRLEVIAKEQAEKEEIIKRDQERREAKIKADADKVEADRRKLDEDKRLEQAKKEAAEKARIETEARMKREAEEDARREQLRKEEGILAERRAKEEAERQEALKPDKEKLLEWANELENITGPELKIRSKIVENARIRLSEVADFIKTETKKL